MLSTLPILALQIALASFALVAPLGAQTITVTTSSEEIDFGGTRQVANLPGPDGRISFHEAVEAANNTPGPQTIAFAIPRAEWEEHLFPGVAMVQYSNLLILLSGDDTTIDFDTQRALTGDTNPNGNEVGLHYSGPPSNIPFLYITASNCLIKGLGPTFGNAFGASVFICGNNNRVVGSITSSVEIDAFDGDATGNFIGGTETGEGNTLLSVRIEGGASGNTVIGNEIRGIQIRGDTLFGPCVDNRVGGPTAAERNTISGNGRTGEEGFPTGIQVELSQSRRTVIENNFIGTTTDGMGPYPIRNGTAGIIVGGGCVGTVVRGNLVSGIARTGSNHYQGQRFGVGIVVNNDSSDTTIVGNRLGVAADGVTPIVNVSGVSCTTMTANQAGPLLVRFGGTLPGEGNIVANSERFGLFVNFRTSGVRVSGNSFHSNGDLGIDLATAGNSAGVSPNDVLDADAGGNNQQNFPVVSAAELSAAALRIRGNLTTAPNQAFTIEFFASPACDPSGHGEGEYFLGSVPVVSDAGGNVPFEAVVSAAAALPGWVITATATRESSGDTSEFSACQAIVASPCAADVDDGNGNGVPDGGVTIDDLLYYLAIFDQGVLAADMDDGSGTGTPDGGVTIDDLLFFLTRFDAGC